MLLVASWPDRPAFRVLPSSRSVLSSHSFSISYYILFVVGSESFVSLYGFPFFLCNILWAMGVTLVNDERFVVVVVVLMSSPWLSTEDTFLPCICPNDKNTSSSLSLAPMRWWCLYYPTQWWAEYMQYCWYCFVDEDHTTLSWADNKKKKDASLPPLDPQLSHQLPRLHSKYRLPLHAPFMKPSFFHFFSFLYLLYLLALAVLSFRQQQTFTTFTPYQHLQQHFNNTTAKCHWLQTDPRSRRLTPLTWCSYTRTALFPCMVSTTITTTVQARLDPTDRSRRTIARMSSLPTTAARKPAERKFFFSFALESERTQFFDSKGTWANSLLLWCSIYRISCFHCQKAHLTCDDGKFFFLISTRSMAMSRAKEYCAMCRPWGKERKREFQQSTLEGLCFSYWACLDLYQLCIWTIVAFWSIPLRRPFFHCPSSMLLPQSLSCSHTHTHHNYTQVELRVHMFNTEIGEKKEGQSHY